MFIDYYELFEIEQDASITEIKSAFRKKAIFWHPDRNASKDTTQKMQLINEAYLILKDLEARKRYDIEYIRFSSFKRQKKENTEAKPNQDEQPKATNDGTNYSNQTYSENEEPNSYQEYSIYDEILKRWMTNANMQAVEMAKETIKEFSNIAMVGIKESIKGTMQGLIIQICVGLTIFITIYSKSCN